MDPFRADHLIADMFMKNPPHFLDREGMPLAGMFGTNDELGLHTVDMGALVLHHAVIAGLDLHPGKNGNDRVPFDPRRQRKGNEGLEDRVGCRHPVNAGWDAVPHIRGPFEPVEDLC